MNKSDLSRNQYMLKGSFAKHGYDWWWHSFTAIDKKSGEEKAFFVEYYLINPALSPNKVVLGQSENSINQHENLGNLRSNISSDFRRNIPSYAMLNVGTWGKEKKQLHAFFPLCDCHIDKTKLDVRFGNNTLTETHMKGSVLVTDEQAKDKGYMCDAGEMSFDININKQVSFNVGYGASSLFRKLNAFEMFWHAEGMKTLYEGTVTFDGNEYDVIPEKSYGYADKNWGKNYTSPWVWFSSCNMTSKLTGKKLNNSVIDIGGGRPKAFGIALNRKLLIDFFYEGNKSERKTLSLLGKIKERFFISSCDVAKRHYEGTDYEYNFSKPWTGTNIIFNCYETDTQIIWDIKAKNHNSSMELLGKCDKDEMLLINYESPDGLKLHNRLWNGGTGWGELKLYDKNNKLIDDIELRNAGCEYGEY